MPIKFTLPKSIAGFVATEGDEHGRVWVCQRELVAPSAPHLTARLQGIHDAIFSAIPGLPDPSQIDHIVVVIEPDLSAVAYVNELTPQANVRFNRTVLAGESVYVRDIDDIAEVQLGIDIPPAAAVIVMRSFGWKRSLFFDVTPLAPDRPARDGSLDKTLAQQMLLLLGLPIGAPPGTGSMTRAQHMEDGVARLQKLLHERCEDEGRYQELLEEHPWMLGQTYSRVIRHNALDDAAIPDFTALRCYDECHDIVELKQPFLPLFKSTGQFSANFNDAWNQAEGYLQHTIRNKAYLLQEKQLRFEAPRCLLVCGHGLSVGQLAKLREKTALSRTIDVVTYDHLLSISQHVLERVRTAGNTRL
ncbi:MAG: hypothetical protein AMXMBFR57_32140 [Acidimicrobiia bacterium]